VEGVEKNPVPEFIIRNNLRTLGVDRGDFIDFLKVNNQ